MIKGKDLEELKVPKVAEIRKDSMKPSVKPMRPVRRIVN